MEGITERQRNLGAVHVERDPAQFFDRPRSSYRLVQAERFEHRLCPVEQPSIASVSARAWASAFGGGVGIGSLIGSAMPPSFHS